MAMQTRARPFYYLHVAHLTSARQTRALTYSVSERETESQRISVNFSGKKKEADKENDERDRKIVAGREKGGEKRLQWSKIARAVRWVGNIKVA